MKRQYRVSELPFGEFSSNIDASSLGHWKVRGRLSVSNKLFLSLACARAEVHFVLKIQDICMIFDHNSC